MSQAANTVSYDILFDLKVVEKIILNCLKAFKIPDFLMRI